MRDLGVVSVAGHDSVLLLLAHRRRWYVSYVGAKRRPKKQNYKGVCEFGAERDARLYQRSVEVCTLEPIPPPSRMKHLMQMLERSEYPPLMLRLAIVARLCPRQMGLGTVKRPVCTLWTNTRVHPISRRASAYVSC